MKTAGRRVGRISGFLNLLKPPGMTSHDAVSYVRRLTGGIRVGHGGTLDPGAAGVLPLALGASTRFLEYCLAWDKEYVAEITFGVSTSSDDAQGVVLSEQSAEWLVEHDVALALTRIAERREQAPPRVCALRYEGKRLYELTAQKKDVPLKPRPVTIYRIDLNRWEPGPRPRAIVKVVCSHGTYIRSIARDAGEDLGVGAHVSFLVRTRSGRLSADKAITLEELSETLVGSGSTGLERVLMSPVDVLAYMPAVKLNRRGFAQVSNGGVAPRDDIIEWVNPEAQSPPVKWHGYAGRSPAGISSEAGSSNGRYGSGTASAGKVRLLSENGAFFGVGRVDQTGSIRPVKIVPVESGADG